MWGSCESRILVQEAMTVDSVDTSEFAEWLQARKDEAQKKKHEQQNRQTA